MHRVELRITDAMYDAAVKYAASRGFAGRPGRGVQIVLTDSLRANLNKNGFKAAQLDLNDTEYAEARTDASGGAPGARRAAK